MVATRNLKIVEYFRCSKTVLPPLNCILFNLQPLMTRCFMHSWWFIRYASKRMQKFDKFFRHFLITNRATLLWFASGFVREAPGHGLRRFLPNVPQFGEHAAFSRQKAPQSLDCGAAIQSASLLVGEKRRTCRHVFKCRCSAFVAFFLTRTVCTLKADSHYKLNVT